MDPTNNLSSHYWEHTRQQDGWTVLAPPAAAAGLPPPYTPEDNALPAAIPVASAPTAAATAAAATLPFCIPTNSNFIGAVPVTRAREYARDVPFAVAFPEICRIMGLASSRACLGYKWDNEKAGTPIHQLLNAGDWSHCLDSGIGMQSRARTRTVICTIKNLNLPETAPAMALATSASTTAGGKKRKSSGNSPDNKKTYDFTQEYRQLKKKLECAMHKGQLCFVSNVDGHHKEVDREHASLWAKEITMGHASFTKPPENIMFQDYFLPAPKRARNTRDTQANSSTNPCVPTIHVTVNTGSSNRLSLSPPHPLRCSPLSTITAATANTNNADIPSSLYRAQPDTDIYASSSSNDIRYPMVIEVLQMINNSGLFADSGEIDFPVVVFVDNLARSQITHVDHVPILDTSYYVEVINMPAALAELFVEELITATGRAQKGKAGCKQTTH
ncbi:hypothetical protein DFH08DRAFT_1079711 [Mycena albidolilacea]|uniref:Uncharacterized protein n=1 Tax=Mycena albidolilacea TaxID=1033008 RepID=A0AAD7ETW7_9AGAR|nr:hypothetical protein DFH08DRAFT_1079711 [Mycena albidolilacea]